MLPLWSWGFGEQCIGGRVGVTFLYSLVSGLLEVVDCLGYFRGMDGEIDKGMRKWLHPGCIIRT